jgi:hypothetical protein
MTITFENDNDIIVYALKRIISYAGNNQYIFLAQSVWWISSIIGLQQGLVIHIDNLRRQNNLNLKELGTEKESVVLSDLPEEPRNKPDNQSIHPDRISQIDSSVDINHLDKVLAETDRILENSQIQRKRFDLLRRTRQGKVQPRTLAKKERKWLNRIIQESPELVRKFIK